MSELKAFYLPRYAGQFTLHEVYLKSEADKVIADLEESHKMEVEQLLMEIVKLKAQKAQAEDDCAYWKMCHGNAANAMHETEEYAMQLYKESRHQKFMRCNLLIDYCGLKQNTCEEEKVPFWRKWYLRWCELSDTFKEAE